MDPETTRITFGMTVLFDFIHHNTPKENNLSALGKARFSVLPEHIHFVVDLYSSYQKTLQLLDHG